MAYTKLPATDGSTVYDAARDQHIQSGIEVVEASIPTAAQIAADPALTGTYVSVIWIPASEFKPSDGAPSAGLVSTVLTGYMFDPTINESAYIGTATPVAATAVAVDVYWAKMAATSGDVRWRLDHRTFGAGDLASAAFNLGTIQVLPVPSAQYEIIKTTLETAIPVTNGKMLGLRLYRISSDPTDTYASDVAVIGMAVRPT